MALSLWLAVRQAREAIRTGQPEEARRIVEPFVHEGYRKAIRVNREIATAYRLRAERHLRNDNPEAAWKDLLSAESLNTGEPDLTVLRKTLTKLGVAECRAALQAGKPMHVIDTLARLKQRTAYHPEFDALQDAANHWLLAREQADRGDFSTAMLTFDKTRLAEPNVLQFGFNDFTRELEDRQMRYQDAVSRLTEATQQQRWRDILLAADEVIAVAPNHREARQWKVKAWDTIPHESTTTDNVVSLSTTDFEVPKPLSTTLAGPIPIAKPVVSQTGVPKRFMLWIDGVGSYLVCLNTRVTFGQATANGPVDVPIFADVSRIHAELARDGEGYILESAREVMVNGLATKRTTLKPGDRVTLGSTCQFQFHLPVPISPSARL
jgi:tetratricopeptide (TPR) repeat protein